MVDRFSEGTVDHAQILDHLGGVRQQGTDPDAAVVVVVLGKLVLAGGHGQGFLTGGHSRYPLAVSYVIGQILPEFLHQLGLVVPEVEMTGPTAHEEVDDPLGLGFVVKPTTL